MRAIRVMTVDDCAVTRSVLKQLLDREVDVSVVAEAGSYEEASASLDEMDIDVITLDLNLPGVTGLDMIERFRTVVRGIVVLSGDSSDYPRALELGAVACLDKNRIMYERLRLVRSIHEAACFH